MKINSTSNCHDIAIVGMACRLPGAKNYDIFWDNLSRGVSSIQEITRSKFNIQYYSPTRDEHKCISKWCGLIDEIDQFDNGFFNISPREAGKMDPQQRILLEEAWHCIEDSGISLQMLQGKTTSIYVGVMATTNSLAAYSETDIDIYSAAGMDQYMLANRISYLLGLSGESITIDAACASSMVALNNARRSLANGDCDYAIVAGVNQFSPLRYLLWSKNRMLSPDGRCKTFDKDANGFVSGEGVGVLLLQPLEQAIQAQNHIYGVIKGGAVNHGGKAVSLSAPRVESQRNVIIAAYKDAGFSPDTVTYVEAHGTGTSLGDPIEVEALTQAFETYTADRQFCKIGSVKTNIGHLEAAAGIAGVIKVLLMMRHKQIPASLNLSMVNPMIDFANSPFTIANGLTAWISPQHGLPLRAGISSFGLGGVNGHVLLEEYIDKTVKDGPVAEADCYPFLLSAKTPSSLERLMDNWQAFTKNDNFAKYTLKDISLTLLNGREAFSYRYGALLKNKAEIIEFLKHGINESLIKRTNQSWYLRIGEFAGNGCADLALLLKEFPVFQEKLEQVLDSLNELEDSQQIREGFFRQSWSKPDEPLYRFILTYTVITTLLAAGLSVNSITGFKNGLWTGLAISGITELQEVLAVLCEKKTVEQLKFLRPVIPFYDSVNKQVVKPYVFDEAYIGNLLEVPIADELFFYYLEKSRLVTHQFSFSNCLLEWDTKLKPAGLNVKTMLYDQEAISTEDCKMKLLLMLIMLDSFNVLNQKWNLSERKLVPDQRFSELLDLIKDEVMPKETLIALLTTDNPALTVAAAALNDAQHKINIKKPYRYLRAHSQNLSEIPDIPGWIRQMHALSELPPLTAASVLDFGILAGDALADKKITVDLTPTLSVAFKESLVGLWNQGVDIQWVKLYPGNSFKKISLPGYTFTHTSFCLPEQTAAMATAGAQTVLENNTAGHGCSRLDAPAPDISDSLAVMTFKEIWQEESLDNSLPVRTKSIICFVSNPDNQQAIVTVIQSINQHSKVIFIRQGDTYQRQAPQMYTVCRHEEKSYEEAFRNIRQDHGEVDALLYLWAVEEKSCIQEYSPIVYLLQAIAAARLQPGRVLLAGQFENAWERCYLESWIGFERSVRLVMPDTQVAVILQDLSEQQQDRETAMQNWLQKLWSELQNSKNQSVLYRKGIRYVCQTQATTVPAGQTLLRAGGTYLITGGCGKLGFLFAEHLARKYSANLILTGRAPYDEEKQSKIKALQALGGQARYVQADVCDLTLMQEGLRQAKECFGNIHGVIHAAGIHGTQSILQKDIKKFQEILKPKITGTILLDALLQEENMDFICYFSSIAASLGDIGSCDYAIGNRFQMAYAHYRNQQQNLPGKAIAINWPLWKDGGMGFGDSENTEMYLKASGQRFLEAGEGIDIFERILSQKDAQHIIFVGEPSRIQHFLGMIQDQPSKLTSDAVGSLGQGRRTEMKGLSLVQCLEWDLKEKAGKLLGISRNELNREDNLAEFGFDSVSLAEFATRLTDYYGIEITPALFFGYSTLEKLVQYFLTVHQAAIEEFYREVVAGPPMIPRSQLVAATSTIPRWQNSGFEARSDYQNICEPIAIIGMSGRFSQARNIEEMWQIIADERDVVGRAPADRFFSQDSEHATWKCGWIPGISEFDPLFFEISPREAETMDPRQRLLLQEAWSALEDAGYGTEQIKTGKIGMFVGVEDGDYSLIVGEKKSLTSNHNAILAARLHYFLNLNGPVMAINTACSSGLVAAHQAIMSLRNQECDTAIAAGINCLFTPEGFIRMRQAGMLSPDGRCYAFDKRANGMVPGEAVAVVVLKRLSQAEANGDPIYAVIKGSGINFDGKTNGITAPNGIAQANLLKEIYRKYQVDPEAIEYVVTHGTGTKLGDPVEVNALCDAFKEFTTKQHYCALTSVKTNFGHTLAASGLVSLISLVQALRYETIPASLHCEQENDYILWQESPFYVNKEAKHWDKRDGLSRTGAVSAFGMSGTNAHMVVQSYEAEQTEDLQQQIPYFLLSLSAKTPEALQEKISDMIEFLQSRNGQSKNMASISYTLLAGRHHFHHRYAVVVQGREDALHILKQAGSKEKLPNLFQGRVPRDFSGQKALEQCARDMLLQTWCGQEDQNRYREILCALADLYCQGYELPWNLLYGTAAPRRINLPTYPFRRERYWVQGKAERVIEVENRSEAAEFRAQPVSPHTCTEFICQDTLIEFLKEQIACVLKINKTNIDDTAPITDFGFDSILLLELRNKINTQLKTDFSIQDFAESSDLKVIAARLQYQMALAAVVVTGEQSSGAFTDKEVILI
ncbi:Polyketide synthase PksM [Sporomusa ovata DSM 2662]|uniref:Malonyl CoA-acyl carrier protein transacylase n=1 Tax=Sporomusa ovata TaxID=2378 RepID=A0A0U1KU32_9FIRM|nr:SDR family NAD(P)-dependent oxidoreductase [Sporomusa ovata]EQB24974.1 polyketide synthase PksM [Sporomusa ovata DSM 2662]CQR70174.1 Malonyl CoA-acyl carrier protein transacylase [Sporomusa ovata]